MTQILVLNSGSSSLKFAVYSGARDEKLSLHLSGQVSGLPESPRLQVNGSSRHGRRDEDWSEQKGDIESVVRALMGWLSSAGVEAPAVVGHRIVHGGRDFTAPVVLDGAVLSQLEALEPLAPLHQPSNLAAVRAASKAYPTALAVGVFDTAFHASQPRLARLYALPRDLIDEGVIAYGFHGLSYDYISGRLRTSYGERAGGRVIVAHLGSGVSLCALRDGVSIATTMGFSALDGPPMATRSGSLDPGVLLYLMERHGMGTEALSDLLYRRSGLLGVSSESSDIRKLEASGSPQAREAIDLFVYRVAREIGSLAAALGGLDRIVFTAGIGENSAPVRQSVLEACAWLGVEIDPGANAEGEPVISTSASRVEALVWPTDEQVVIARAAQTLLQNERGQG